MRNSIQLPYVKGNSEDILELSNFLNDLGYHIISGKENPSIIKFNGNYYPAFIENDLSGSTFSIWLGKAKDTYGESCTPFVVELNLPQDMQKAKNIFSNIKKIEYEIY